MAADDDEETGLPLRGSLTFLLALAGAAGGAVVVFADYRGWGHDNRAFVSSGPFVLWLGLICAQTAVWAVGIPILVRIQQGLGHAGEWRLRGTAAAMFLVALAGGIAGAVVPDVKGWHSFQFVHGRAWKISLLSLFGAAVAVYGMAGMWRIYYELRSKRGSPVTLAYLPTYLKLHDKLQQLITMLGGALGLVVLAAAAERNAATVWDARTCPHPSPLERFLGDLGLGGGGGGCGGEYPYEYVLVYGFYFTALIGFAYVPVGLALLDVGRRIRASVAPIADAMAPNADIGAWQDKRSKLAEILDLDLGTATSFRTAIAILTPVIGSLTGLLFKAG